jgi:hypothetical protein
MAGKKITELNSGSLSNLPLSGVTAVVYSGLTLQHSLSDLRLKLVDSGSHHFTGSQHFNGDLTITGSIKSLIVGTGSFHIDNPEILHVQNSGSYNIAHFESNNEYYAQVNIKNTSSGSNSSTDLVLTADNGTEGVHFIDLGINSSTYTGGLVGRENDAYLLNVGKDMYIGTVGGENHPSKLFLFGQNNWENPQITVSGSGQVSFNTCSCDPGFTYQFSGSAKMQNDLNVSGSVTASYFVGDGSQLTNLPIQTTDVSMFLSSSTFNSFTQSIDDRTDVIETSLSNLPTNLINLGFSTTSSYFTFNETTMSMSTGENMVLQTSYSGTVIGTDTETATDSQGGQDTLTFSAWIEGSGGIDYPSIVNVQPNWRASGPGLSVGATVASVNTLVFSPGQSVYQITLNTGYGLFQTGEEYTFTEPDTVGTITKNWVFESGSNLIVPNGGNIIGASNLATTGSNDFVGNQIVTGSITTTGVLNVGIGSGDEGGEIMLARPITNTTITGSGVIIDSYRDTIRIFEQSGSTRGAFLDVTKQSNSVSSQIVTSPNLFSIETITSASYVSITPVSGTLYIIID